jgi:hypothetical protein
VAGRAAPYGSVFDFLPSTVTRLLAQRTGLDEVHEAVA